MALLYLGNIYTTIGCAKMYKTMDAMYQPDVNRYGCIKPITSPEANKEILPIFAKFSIFEFTICAVKALLTLRALFMTNGEANVAPNPQIAPRI